MLETRYYAYILTGGLMAVICDLAQVRISGHIGCFHRELWQGVNGFGELPVPWSVSGNVFDLAKTTQLKLVT
jgi:hypothetical protein